jgi:hypothetical protein
MYIMNSYTKFKLGFTSGYILLSGSAFYINCKMNKELWDKKYKLKNNYPIMY